MKAVATVKIYHRPIKVHQNTTKNQPNFGVIKCAITNEVLHRGQVGYIKKLAKSKYNTIANI